MRILLIFSQPLKLSSLHHSITYKCVWGAPISGHRLLKLRKIFEKYGYWHVILNIFYLSKCHKPKRATIALNIPGQHNLHFTSMSNSLGNFLPTQNKLSCDQNDKKKPCHSKGFSCYFDCTARNTLRQMESVESSLVKWEFPQNRTMTWNGNCAGPSIRVGIMCKIKKQFEGLQSAWSKNFQIFLISHTSRQFCNLCRLKYKRWPICLKIQYISSYSSPL